MQARFRTRVASAVRTTLSESLERRTLFSSLFVNSALDNASAGDGLVTLREAIIAANTDGTTDLGQSGNGDDTITFDLGEEPQTISLASVLPDLNSDMTVQGPGANLLSVRRNAASVFRIFRSQTNRTVHLSGMTIANGSLLSADGGGVANTGNLFISDCVFSGNHARLGGALLNIVGSLTMDHCTFSGNSSSSNGGAVVNRQNGSLSTITNCTFDQNSTSSSGAGIGNDSGCSLLVTACTFTANSADFSGGGIWNVGTLTAEQCTLEGNSTGTNGGGGIFNSGALALSKSTVTGNTSPQDTGGGIYNYFGNATVKNTTITGNSAAFGAGVRNYGDGNNGGSVLLDHCTISDNFALAGVGGGIWSETGGSVSALNCTISNNSAGSYAGGGVFNNGIFELNDSTASANTAGYGGAIYDVGSLTASGCTFEANNASTGGGVFIASSAVLVNSTFHGNSAYYGGAIYSQGILAATNCTISGNTAFYFYGGGIYSYGSASLKNCIVALNTNDVYGVDTSNHNFIGDIDGDPKLGPLSDNGGPTHTMAVLPGSPCIDAGDASSASTYDQRGASFARVSGAGIDIGAIEIQTQIVDTTADTSDGNYSAGNLSLREAIELANQADGPDRITFDQTVFGSPQTINLSSALPELSSVIDLHGPGAGLLTVRRNGDDDFRIFGVSSFANLSGLTISNGSAVGAEPNQFGGGVYNAGTLSIDHAVISGNASEGDGGGVYSAGDLTITDSTLSSNDSGSRSGGAIFNKLGALSIRNCTISGNNAASGGGIFNYNGASLSIESSTLNNNLGRFGGGAIFNAGFASIVDDTIAFNTANTNGGGIYALATSALSVNCSTITRNTAVIGGGIAGLLAIFDLNNSIVARNTATTDTEISGAYDGNYNFIGGDPQLGPLANNGGPTWTMAISIDGPCLNAGDPDFGFPPFFDQRGLPRVSAGGVDIGAFEYQAVESLVVTTTVDENNGTSDANFGIGTSVREAITYANNHEGADTITFALRAGEHSIDLTAPLPDLYSEMTLDGPGANLLTIRRDSGGDYRVFTVSGTVTLEGITITNGNDYYGGGIYSYGALTMNNCVLRGNNVGSQGGAIYNYSGPLNMTDCQLTDNTASDGGGIYNDYGTVTITRCTLSSKGAASFGGGVYSYGGSVSLIDSTVQGNTAASQGGGIFVNSCYLTVSGSTISGNVAATVGGGIYGIYSNITLTNSTLAENTGFEHFGGGGGAIYAYYSTLNVQNSTIAKNDAYRGGGILNFSSTSSIDISNSIVATNTAAGGNANVFGPFNDLGFNFIGGDPMLGTLADNGGPTQTMALLPNSPCINSGNPDFVSPPEFDQRGAGFNRVIANRLDIGALEVQNAQANGIWTGLGDHVAWSDPANWMNNAVPKLGDHVVIALPGNYTVNLAAAFTDVRAITLGGDAGAAPTLSVQGGGTRLLKTGELSIRPDATLDLNDNDLIVDYSGDSQLTAVQALINSARAGGAWTGTGITSSAARTATPAITTLAALEASTFKLLYGTDAQFDGQSIDDTAVLVKYTYYGDTDFSGKVDSADYARIDSAFDQEASQGDSGGWINGDFDGNGKVDGADYALIDAAFNQQTSTLRQGTGATRRV